VGEPIRISTLHYCQCGWKRTITDTATWRYKLIDHLVYGPITNYRAAILDVQLHDCHQTHLAYRRSPRSRAEQMVDYRPYGIGGGRAA
jgi:hypothetical protein